MTTIVEEELPRKCKIMIIRWNIFHFLSAVEAPSTLYAREISSEIETLCKREENVSLSTG